MDLSIIPYTLTLISSSKLLIPPHNFNKFTSNDLTFLSSDYSPLISAAIFPLDAVAPPPVKTHYPKTATKTLIPKKQRTKRKSSTDGGDNDNGEFGSFSGDGWNGNFGGGGWEGGGGGRGWNFGGFGGAEWEEEWSWNNSSVYDPAFDFVYEVLCWIVLSNCLHFAVKKVLRIVAVGIYKGRALESS